MKILAIAYKDLVSSFRSAFAIIFMFGIPLLVTGIFYFMFGGSGDNQEIDLAATRVVIVNLDEGSPDFAATTSSITGSPASSLGELVAGILQQPEYADLMDVSLAMDAAEARQAVDEQQAGLAIILPADFTRRFSNLDQQAVIEIYADPTLTLGPAIVQSIVRNMADEISGARIATSVAVSMHGNVGPEIVGQVMVAYQQALVGEGGNQAALVATRSPVAESAPNEDAKQSLLGPIMGGMLIFYAFYTGTSTAQTILQEEERKTLPRLFTTPTPQAAILAGKFLAVLLTVLVQVVVLFVLARLIFGIAWGSFWPVALTAAGTVLSASAFGIFVNSLLKDTRQSGVIFGGVLTMSGMLGMMPIFTGASLNGGLMTSVALLVPQGWSVRSLFQALDGAPLLDVSLTGLALLAWSAVLFGIGIWRFAKRYA